MCRTVCNQIIRFSATHYRREYEGLSIAFNCRFHATRRQNATSRNLFARRFWPPQGMDFFAPFSWRNCSISFLRSVRSCSSTRFSMGPDLPFCHGRGNHEGHTARGNCALIAMAVAQGLRFGVLVCISRASPPWPFLQPPIFVSLGENWSSFRKSLRNRP